MEISELKSRLDKSLEYLRSELAQIRTGRATPNLVEDIMINAYGAKMTLKELGSIVVLDPQNIVVTPWDTNLLGDISKAIRESDLKLNPVEESDRLRIPVPSLTEERRVEFTKIVSTKLEEAKAAFRNTRNDAMKDVEKDFSNKEIGEDEKFRTKEEIEKVVKDYTEKADDVAEKKRADIMQV